MEEQCVWNCVWKVSLRAPRAVTLVDGSPRACNVCDVMLARQEEQRVRFQNDRVSTSTSPVIWLTVHRAPASVRGVVFVVFLGMFLVFLTLMLNLESYGSRNSKFKGFSDFLPLLCTLSSIFLM